MNKFWMIYLDSVDYGNATSITVVRGDRRVAVRVFHKDSQNAVVRALHDLAALVDSLPEDKEPEKLVSIPTWAWRAAYIKTHWANCESDVLEADCLEARARKLFNNDQQKGDPCNDTH
jgi:hypothetical protein